MWGSLNSRARGFGHSLVPFITKSEGMQDINPTQLGGDKVGVCLVSFYFQ